MNDTKIDKRSKEYKELMAERNRLRAEQMLKSEQADAFSSQVTPEFKPSFITQVDPVESLIYSIRNGTAKIVKDERTGNRIAEIRLNEGHRFDLNLECGYDPSDNLARVRNHLIANFAIVG